MKTFLILLVGILALNCEAVERRSYANVPINEFTEETQTQPENAGDNHLTLVWWVPYEYWASVLSRDPSMNKLALQQTLDVLRNYMLIAIVQADVSPFGTFDFYSNEEVAKNLSTSYTQSSNDSIEIAPTSSISGDMQLLLSQMTPILKAAMGNLGSNFHFFVYNDRRGDDTRVIDPYNSGLLSVQLKKSGGEFMEVSFPTPLNSLHVPRICPNGKPAHISWSYCPWSGKKL